MENENRELSDEDRQKLAVQMDQELEDYIEKLPRTPYTNGFTENIDQELEEHPAFNTTLPDGELPPLLEALAQLKYSTDENTPEELAQSYKDDGNFNFNLKDYNLAIRCYSKALEEKFSNDLLTAQLYTNRAAAQYHLGNYGFSLKDCVEARKFLPNHMKAIVRGAQSCLQLKRFSEAIEWCDQGLTLNSKQQVLVEVKKDAVKGQKKAELERRKAVLMDKKNRALIEAFKVRNVRISGLTYDDSSDLVDISAVGPVHPDAGKYRVHLDQNGALVWPVIFNYPEHTETDFIQAFNENTSLIDHLEEMFKEGPEWDKEKKYTADTLTVYFENIEAAGLCKIDNSKTLRDILSDNRYTVLGGIPSFIVLVEGSSFQKSYLDEHKLA